MDYETAIVHQHALMRAGLTRLFDNSPFRVVASSANFGDLVASVLPQQEPVLVLVDLGDNSLAHFKQMWPAARIVALAEHPDVDEAASAFRAGANAYLANVRSGDALIKSLELVIAGAAIFPFDVLSIILGKNRTSQPIDVADSGNRAASIAAFVP